MNTFRAPAGATRLCPHCRAVILQSASSCPACQKHLKFEPGAAATPAPSFSALNLEGAVRHPDVGQPWEYSVLVSIKNDKGEEVTRQVVNVGALEPGEQRSFTFSVDVFVPGDAKATTPAAGVSPATTSPAVAAAAAAGLSVRAEWNATRNAAGDGRNAAGRSSGPDSSSHDAKCAATARVARPT